MMDLIKDYEEHSLDADIALNMDGEINSNKYKDMTIQRALASLSNPNPTAGFTQFIILINTLESQCRADNSLKDEMYEAKLEERRKKEELNKDARKEIIETRMAVYKFELILTELYKRKFDDSPLVIKKLKKGKEETDKMVEIPL